jgi:serine/threonine protein kinase
VYLIDFGIAANLLSSRRSSSSVSGTAAYMAPERFAGRGDHRVDVYALGCVLYETLIGVPPFSGDLVQLMHAHVHAEVPRPSAARAGLPPALDAVVRRAMAKDPADRFPSAGELAGAARQAMAGAPTSTPPTMPATAPSAGPPTRPWPAMTRR